MSSDPELVGQKLSLGNDLLVAGVLLLAIVTLGLFWLWVGTLSHDL